MFARHSRRSPLKTELLGVSEGLDFGALRGKACFDIRQLVCRLAFHSWAFSLLICSVRLGRSAVGRVLKYVLSQKGSVFS
jgi:hypothetical protein